MTGLNGWFIIEILSFYGYILSAVIFIFCKSVASSLGWSKNTHWKVQEAYKFDFIAFYRKDIDWLAFVTILLLVNICLIGIDKLVIFTKENPNYDTNAKFPLSHVQYLLLFNHLLQLIFLRDFYDAERRVNMNHRWVWVVHFFSYAYVAYQYFFTDARKIDQS